jgi:ribosomal protein S18 acetylase RimI-like enzyme
MRIARFTKAHLRAFNSLLLESESEFGKAWALRMKQVFSSSGCRKCGLETFAVLENKKLAAAFSTRHEVEALVVYFIIIGREFQGKGIGSSIISRIECMAREKGAKFLRLDIYSGKPVASFYKKQGFKFGGRVRFYEEEGDDQAFMYKRL